MARRRPSGRRAIWARHFVHNHAIVRIALGLSYLGTPYQGWQSQPSGQTVQDRLEAALGQFATVPVATLCAGRTDAGVHGLMQVVHFDTDLRREPFSWVRGTNRYLPPDIAVQWAQPVPPEFHARASALARLDLSEIALGYPRIARELAPTDPALGPAKANHPPDLGGKIEGFSPAFRWRRLSTHLRVRLRIRHAVTSRVYPR